MCKGLLIRCGNNICTTAIVRIDQSDGGGYNAPPMRCIFSTRCILFAEGKDTSFFMPKFAKKFTELTV